LKTWSLKTFYFGFAAFLLLFLKSLGEPHSCKALVMCSFLSDYPLVLWQCYCIYLVMFLWHQVWTKIPMLVGVCLLSIHEKYDRSILLPYHQCVKEWQWPLTLFFLRELNIACCINGVYVRCKLFTSFLHGLHYVIHESYPQLGLTLYGSCGDGLLFKPFQK